MLQSLQCERGVKKYIAAIIAEQKKKVFRLSLKSPGAETNGLLLFKSDKNGSSKQKWPFLASASTGLGEGWHLPPA